jgi:hypothetical protein
LHPATAIKPKLTEEETEHHDEHENSNTAMLTAEQMKSIKIELGALRKNNLPLHSKQMELLKVPNQNKANATALSLGGVIKSILVQTGNTVKQRTSNCHHFKQFFYHNARGIFKCFFKSRVGTIGICPTKRIATRQCRSIKKFAISRCRT